VKRTIIGVILIFISIAGIVGWELFGREELMYTDMLTLNQDVEAYTIITEDMLTSRKVCNPLPNAYRWERAADIVGMEATQYIAMGTELMPRYFEKEALSVNPDEEYVFSMDVGDLQSYPKSVARGDRVYLYSSDEMVIATVVLAIKDSTGCEIVHSEDRTKVSGQAASIEFKMKENEVGLLSSLISDGYPIAVAYN